MSLCACRVDDTRTIVNDKLCLTSLLIGCMLEDASEESLCLVVGGGVSWHGWGTVYTILV